MTTETRACQSCAADFTIEPEDFAFYEKMQVPPPTFCPQCRFVRRLAFRNERTLYRRKCDLCGKDKIMMYAADAPFPVYCRECWLGDGWDGKQFGRDYDFSRPFFAQFAELFRLVPRVGVIAQGNMVESEYTNRVTDQRNCYLVFGSTRDEFCRYGSWFNDSKECIDCYSVQKCERCHECVDCFQCYNLAFSQECASCSDSWLLYNCTNCQDCFGCVNLRNKKYHIFNKEYSKEDYQKTIAQMGVGSRLVFEGLKAKFEALKKQAIVPALVTHHSVNMSGNWIENAKNTTRSFNCRNTEDVRYGFSLFDTKDSMDHSYWGNVAERVYDSISVGIQVADIKFTNESWSNLRNLEYCMNCQQGSHDLFGCTGLKNAAYCILNKQYTEEEYNALVPKIIAQMKEMPYRDAKGRMYGYGEFFPAELSPSAYNETLAQEFFPLSKEEILAAGYHWREPEGRNYQITIAAADLPDNAQDAPDTLAQEIIGCAHAGKCNDQCTTAFRILPEDLTIYKLARLPLPTLCPNCRHYARIRERNGFALSRRACICKGKERAKGGAGQDYANTGTHFHGDGACPNEFETSYGPERTEIVYCESCYNAEVA